MNLFETTSIVNENTYKELLSQLVSPMRKVIICLLGILYIFFIVNDVLTGRYTRGIFVSLVLLYFTARTIRNYKRYVKTNTLKIIERVHANEYRCITSFSDIGMSVKNEATNEEFSIYYDDMVRFAETKTYYVLFTKAKQAGLINKAQIIENNNKEKLYDYIAKNCKNIG